MRPVRELKRRICSRVHLDLGGGWDQSVLVAGSGRSGTTWLGDLINYRNDFRYIFEPFHPQYVDMYSAFHENHYLAAHHDAPDFLAVSKKVFTGKIRGAWVDSLNRKLVSRRRLVKDIRINLSLGWIAGHFPGMPIVLILRHPCAVAISKIKHGAGWKSLIPDMLDQPQLMENHLAPFASQLADLEGDFEQYVAQWCIENLVPLRDCSANVLHIVFYEELCQASDEQLMKLCSYVNIPWETRMRNEIPQPSLLCRKGSRVRTGGDRVLGWREDVSDDQVRRAMDVMGLFGMADLYGEDGLPRRSVVMNLLNEERAA